MTVDGTQQVRTHTPIDFEYNPLEREPRRVVITERPLVRGIIDITMVGLVGGGPRLAVKAARVMLEEGYSERRARIGGLG